MIMKRVVLLFTVPLVCIVLLAMIFVLQDRSLRNDHQTAQEQAYTQKRILLHIAKHNGEVFDYVAVAKMLNITHMQVFGHLNDLERADKIVAHQKSLRKPVLIQKTDFTNYYWRIFITSAAHPRSELGTLGRLHQQ